MLKIMNRKRGYMDIVSTYIIHNDFIKCPKITQVYIITEFLNDSVIIHGKFHNITLRRYLSH